MINLWNPSGHLPLDTILLTALLLGMIHGITPDEHTWPITFSYAVGNFSARGGLKAGLLFALAFTLQRSIASEIAYLSLHTILRFASWEFPIYIIVGLIMAFSGGYILRIGKHLHILGRMERWIEHLILRFTSSLSERRQADPHRQGSLTVDKSNVATAADDSTAIKGPNGHSGMLAPRRVPVRLALLHGFVAGWGTGAFALILYTVLSPQMPAATVGFVPGLLFGIGTLLMQMLLGALFGWWIGRLHVSRDVLPVIARRVSGSVLLYGGLAFMVAGFLGLFLPLDQLQLKTGIHIHNLDTINSGTFLAVGVVAAVAWTSLVRSLREIRAQAQR